MSTGLSPIFAYCGPSPEQINRYSRKQTARNCRYYQPVVLFRWCFCLLCFRLRLHLWFCLDLRLCASLLRRFFCSGGAVFGQPFRNFGVIPAVHGPRAALRDSRYFFRLRKSLRLDAIIHGGRRTFYHPANFFNRDKLSHISLILLAGFTPEEFAAMLFQFRQHAFSFRQVQSCRPFPLESF